MHLYGQKSININNNTYLCNNPYGKGTRTGGVNYVSINYIFCNK